MIETPNLILRTWRESDYAPFAALNGDEMVMRYYPSALTPEESMALIKRRIEPHFRRHGFGFWAIERKGDGRFLGLCGLEYVNVPCPVKGEVKATWRLARHAWGAGYAFEAASAALQFGFKALQLEQIVAFSVPANERSIRLIGRLGMIRRSELDFDHPSYSAEDPRRRYVVYSRARATSGCGGE